jgi:hypothetical protein
MTCIQSNYKLCEQLHKFTGKKVIITQKLKAHHCKEERRRFVLCPLQVQCMLNLLPCTHQDDVLLRAKHFALKADQAL